VERLRTIHAVAAEAKAVPAAIGSELMGEWAEYAPPRLFAWVLEQWAARRGAAYFPAAINLIVSNVPGPTSALFVPGHRLEAIYSVGPVLEGIGLNITAWSYLDALHVGVLACREMVPEPHRIAEGMRAALDELVARTDLGR
jgi:diacylglycerol O-acyltransferase / wax synthase